jgi:hypothetical protein
MDGWMDRWMGGQMMMTITSECTGKVYITAQVTFTYIYI